MTITLTPTDNIVKANDVPCRLWQGRTERGIEIFALVAAIAVEHAQDQSAFGEELREIPVVVAFE